MEGQSSKLLRTPSSLIRTPTLRSSIHNLGALEEVELDREEAKPHPPPHSAVTSVVPSASGQRLAILSLILILLFLLSVLYLSDQSPSLWSLSIGSAVVAAGSLALSRSRLSLSRRRVGRTDVRWFIGDDEGDVENPRGKGEEKSVTEGVEFYSNGDFYEGEFHRGKCSGSGVYNFFGKGRYEGDWIDGQYDGYGVEKVGEGYAGEWVGGQSHGRGVQTCSDGSCYVGEFKCGVKHGVGFYQFRNGDKYAGEYFGDKIHGFGVYHFANGHCYEGSWHEGRRQGFGTYSFRRGETRSGEWDCGALKNPLSPTDPSVQRAVQSARKASESSFLLPRIDEKVNKAAAAANRAATAARVAAVKAVQNRMNGRFCTREA
ncbi:hypothetical protein HPP92_002223 [Vanilla planifolia]|uniref:Uncharacterized protein n=1 Tax=Vanilla planifolia TaxID=51239 RepID=A0A835S4X5_VANPL|nr:hypothetical protein HPP92_002223 [Vanilla planifolia]